MTFRYSSSMSEWCSAVPAAPWSDHSAGGLAGRARPAADRRVMMSTCPGTRLASTIDQRHARPSGGRNSAPVFVVDAGATASPSHCAVGVGAAS